MHFVRMVAVAVVGVVLETLCALSKRAVRIPCGVWGLSGSFKQSIDNVHGLEIEQTFLNHVPIK